MTDHRNLTAVSERVLSSGSPASHCARILALLSDGKPHTHRELYSLGTVAHSRIAALRKRGFRIPPAEKIGGDYVYRLLADEDVAA